DAKALAIGTCLRQLDEVIVESTGHQCLKAAPHEQIGFEAAAARLKFEAQGMVRSTVHDVVDVRTEDELLVATVVFHLHLDSEERRVVNGNNHLLYRRDEIRAAVGVLAENAREQFHEGFAAYGAILVKPCPV